MTLLIAGITDGAWNLFWMYLWLVSTIAASYLSDRKGYGDRPGLATGLILSIIGAMQTFDIPVMLAGGTQSSAPGGTDRAGLTALILIYWTAFKYTSFGYAAAMAVGLFVLIIMFTYVYNRFQGRNPTE
jgi:ABC-type spermidine/putrescine transport system permease subunit I